jgi:hypothetical protein
MRDAGTQHGEQSKGGRGGIDRIEIFFKLEDAIATAAGTGFVICLKRPFAVGRLMPRQPLQTTQHRGF